MERSAKLVDCPLCLCFRSEEATVSLEYGGLSKKKWQNPGPRDECAVGCWRRWSFWLFRSSCGVTWEVFGFGQQASQAQMENVAVTTLTGL